MKLRISLGTLLLAAIASPAGAVNVVFDYSYDNTGFFSSDKRAVLNQVAQVFGQNLTDTLSAISSSGSNVFDAKLFDPRDPLNSVVTINNFSVPADTVRIFVGSKAFGTQTLGVGGPGFESVSGSTAFIRNAVSRGETGALLAAPTDFGPWGGSITFSSTMPWYVDSDVRTLESFAGKYDFYTVAMHETAHVFGIGTADSWSSLVSSHTFTGIRSSQLNGGLPLALQNDGTDAHFATSVIGQANGVAQQTLLSPFINSGSRKFMTNLDWAALDDIGWEVASLQATVPSAVPEPGGWAMMLGGMLLIGGMVRRRI